MNWACWFRDKQTELAPIPINLDTLYEECKEHDKKAIRLAFNKKYSEAQAEIRLKEKKMGQLKQLTTDCLAKLAEEDIQALEKKRSMIIA